jgi:hypothetical protein
VIINAHNFTPAGPDFSVNGKDPIGVWCPSLDEVGNGTTTLTDFIGSSDGVFNNMNAATDWVSDTGAGGIRAVSLNGIAGMVIIPPFATGITAWSLSWWQKINDISGFRVGISFEGSPYFHIPYNSVATFYNTRPDDRLAVSLNTTDWFHIGVVETGSVGKLYVNGVLQGSYTGGSAGSINSKSLYIGGRLPGGVNAVTGRFDDIRVFGVALADADLAELNTRQRGG